MKRKIETEPTTIYKTVPAPKLQVLLWLVTFGRKGKLWVIDVIPGTLYKTPNDPRTNINCRCVTSFEFQATKTKNDLETKLVKS